MFKANFLLTLTISCWGLLSAQTINITELCALAPEAKILQPHSCSDWIKCPKANAAILEEMETGSCVYGYYFDKNLGSCQYQENVQCPFESTPKDRCSLVSEGTFLADKEQCNAYIYCNAGKELRSYCPGNLVFDAINKACVYPNQYKCPESRPPTKSDDICLSLKDGRLFADKDDCSKYSECQNGQLLSHACNSSYAWDYVEQRCVPLENVQCYPLAKKPEPELKVCVDHEGPVADGISCSGYYFCKRMEKGKYDRKPEHFTCAKGLFFDEATKSCRDRLNVKCSLDRCEGMGNKYVNVAGNCRAYILCHNGVTRNQSTCPNNYYFDERTQGCTPQVVSYAACSA